MGWTVWWTWMAAGLIIAIIELLVPAFIFLGIALGCFGVALGLAVGVLGGLSAPWLLVCFASLACAGYIVLRMAFGAPKGSVKIWDTDINDN